LCEGTRVCEWRNSEYLCQFPDQDNLHLQVSNVLCTWLRLGEA
jgi:hypothetical protein